MSIRIHELAKLLDRKSKELVDLAVSLGFAVKSHSNSLDDAQVAKLKAALGAGPSAEAKPAAGEAKPKAAKKPAAAKKPKAAKGAKEEAAAPAVAAAPAAPAAPAKPAGPPAKVPPALRPLRRTVRPPTGPPPEVAKVVGKIDLTKVTAPRPPAPRPGFPPRGVMPGKPPVAPAKPAAPPSRPMPVPMSQKPLTPRKPSPKPAQIAKIIYRPGDEGGPPEKPSKKKRPTPQPLARIHLEPDEDTVAAKLRKAFKKDLEERKWTGGVPDEEGAEAPTRLRAPFRRRVKPMPMAAPAPVVAKIAPKPTQAELVTPVTIKDFSSALGVKAGVIIGKLVAMGIMANINQSLEDEMVQLLAGELGVKVTLKKPRDAAEDMMELRKAEDKPEDLSPRAPVVTFMGHVDHGKTSLLDAIRKANVVASEAGGITQHIGAYTVTTVAGKRVTFLDTPGHQAFTEMRARGANITDVAVLVVAADDGVMPQTEEAINHAKEADVPIVVAMNKMDLPQANPDKVKQQLASLGLIWDQWGGKTVIVACSATKKTGLDELVEMLSLEAELLELKANPKRQAEGAVIEARQSEGRGVTATILVRNGTLHVGDVILCGRAYGRVRAMYDDKGVELKEAGPSTPVSVTGLDVMPEAGDKMFVVGDLAEAQAVAEERERKMRQESLGTRKGIKLEEFFEFMKQSEITELRVIVKADVKGSLEVLRKTVEEVHSPEVRVRVLHAAVGGINESDVLLASASQAVIIGFHVVAEEKARYLAEEKGVDIRIYQIIYQVGDDVRKAVEGLLAPGKRELVDGHVEVREIFKVSRIGTIAGCYVTDGLISRQSKLRINRDGKTIYEGRLETLKRFKDDVREVRAGFECGIKVAGYDDLKVGDQFEAYHVEEFARKL